MKNEDLPKLITRVDLADYLGVSPRTLRNYELSGKLKSLRIGKKKYYAKEDVKQLVRNGND